MKKVILVLVALGMVGCASAPRTKWTDKTMRVMIDPESIDAQNYVKIQYSLVASGKWIVVDRKDGLRAIKHEQDMLHRTESDRYDDREKYAMWGKLYGVGGVIVAHSQCQRRDGFFPGQYNRCRQNLAIMDTNNGEVIAVSEARADSDAWNEMPDWEDAVSVLNDNFPKNFEKDKTDKRLAEYKDLAREEAIRQKEELVNMNRAPAAVKAPEPVKAPDPHQIIDVPAVPSAPAVPKAEAPKAEAPKAEPVKQDLPEQAKAVEHADENSKIAKVSNGKN
jgi:hypothetical protein